MEALGLYSPTSSTTSSTDSTCLPKSRIKCSKEVIAVGSQKYEFASEALLAYLRQFESPAGKGLDKVNPGSPTPLLMSGGKGSAKGLQLENGGISLKDLKKTQVSTTALADSGLVVGTNGISMENAKEDVEMLLTSKVSPQLQEEVTDTLREVKLRRLLKQAAMKSQKQTKTGLQQEVEAALIRSAQLLEKVTKEDIPSTKAAISDISTIPTEVLLNNSVLSFDGSEIDEKQSGHIYSYRTSRSQRSPNTSLSQSLCAPVSYTTHRQPRSRTRRSSIDSLLPPVHQLPPHDRRSTSSSSASLSNQSDPTDIIRRIRSRSESPALKSIAAFSTAPDWVQQLDQSVRKSVPSWVGEIELSEASDSVWSSENLLEDKNNRRLSKVPSWIGEVGKTELKEDTHVYDTRPLIPRISSCRTGPMEQGSHYLSTENGLNDTNDITADSRPGLNFSDLATNTLQTSGSNKHVTFTDSTRNSNPPGKHQPKHSTPAKSHRNLSLSEQSFTHPKPSRVLDCEFNGEAFLRNNILPQTAKLKKSMDNFVSSSENLRRKSVSSNSSEASLDTLALLAGRMPSSANGPSPIPKDSEMMSKSYSTSPAISAISPGDKGSNPISNGHDQDSSDGLDGDRSWERVTHSFKPPVPVDCDDVRESNTPLVNGTSPQKGMEGTLSGGRHHGSMEVLKNMLFKLQAEETSTQEGNSQKADTTDSNPQNQSSMALLPALQDYDFKQEPGGHSLEKALVHLNRLKKLVKNTTPSGTTEAAVNNAVMSVPSQNGVGSESN